MTPSSRQDILRKTHFCLTFVIFSYFWPKQTTFSMRRIINHIKEIIDYIRKYSRQISQTILICFCILAIIFFMPREKKMQLLFSVSKTTLLFVLIDAFDKGVVFLQKVAIRFWVVWKVSIFICRCLTLMVCFWWIVCFFR